MGIGPGYCKACSTPEELEEARSYANNLKRNTTIRQALEYLNIPSVMIGGKIHIPEDSRTQALNIFRRELLGETT
jgi:hypothetical protein